MILLAHGLEGSPRGRKAKAFREAGFALDAPDFRGMPLNMRLDLLKKAARQGEASLLAGSSYGGLAAVLLVMDEPERFDRLLLLAPAVHLTEDPVEDPDRLVIPKGIRTLILHGLHDGVVPIEASRALAVRSGSHVELRELTDDHSLAGSLEEMLDAARRLLDAYS